MFVTAEKTHSAVHNPSNNRLLAYSIADFAARLSVSERHVWRLVKTGQIASIKLGRRRLIPRNSVTQMLTERATS